VKHLSIIKTCLFFTFILLTKATFADPAVVTYAQLNRAITLSATNPTFTVALPTNPTTGYSWFLRKYPVNLIIPVSHSFQAGTADRVGAGGTDYWTFKAKPEAFAVPQVMTIRMLYARPWAIKDDSSKVTIVAVTK
jgi:inhibitor of cysteine peptidase